MEILELNYENSLKGTGIAFQIRLYESHVSQLAM